MKKKHRDIVVDGVTYGWQIKYGGNEVWIWLDNKIILETQRCKDKHPITPKDIEYLIRMEVLKQGEYVLLRGKKHGNVFWTSYTKNQNYDSEGFDILYLGNETKEMVVEWGKYNSGWEDYTNILEHM